jgi:hypothetical protein
MIRVLVATALFLSSTAAPAADDQLAAAFRVAFGNGGSVVLKKQGQMKESVRYTPGDLVNAPFGTVLLSPGEVVSPAHASSGKLAAIYLTRTDKGFAVAKKYVPAAETGSFGKIGDWSVNRSFGELPVVTVDGGGTWQGCTISVTTLIELRPDGPKELASVPMTYDNGGAVPEGQKPTQISGRIEKIVPGKSFDVVYFGSKEFTEHYVRKGDSYVLADGGKSRMQTC